MVLSAGVGRSGVWRLKELGNEGREGVILYSIWGDESCFYVGGIAQCDIQPGHVVSENMDVVEFFRNLVYVTGDDSVGEPFAPVRDSQQFLREIMEFRSLCVRKLDIYGSGEGDCLFCHRVNAGQRNGLGQPDHLIGDVVWLVVGSVPWSGGVEYSGARDVRAGRGLCLCWCLFGRNGWGWRRGRRWGCCRSCLAFMYTQPLFGFVCLGTIGTAMHGLTILRAIFYVDSHVIPIVTYNRTIT